MHDPIRLTRTKSICFVLKRWDTPHTITQGKLTICTKHLASATFSAHNGQFKGFDFASAGTIDRRTMNRMGTMTDHISLQSGTELVGDYRIDRVLGAGGFGITYLAQELALDRHVTIKEYFPSDFAARADGFDAVPKSLDCSGDYRWGLDRFIEEAQTLARFDHPNIVRVYRYFRANNTGYMVLHFEEGQSLKTWLRGLNRAPRQKELDAMVPKLLDALELIHTADFLHRDIAPDNIIIRKNGEPVLIDFGSARGEIASHSKTVSALVKPGYSPYEQYAETSSKQGPWTDIYALGATLYHAVTGKRPPDSPSRMVADEYVSAAEAAVGGYRKNFLKAIDHALKLKVETRPKSVAAWRRALMAKDPTRRGWRTSAAQKPKKAGTTPKQPAKQPAKQKAAAQKIPRAPGQDAKASKTKRAGGLVEFLDGLKSKPLKAKAGEARAEKAVQVTPEPTPPLAKAKDAKAPVVHANAAKSHKGKRTWRISTMLKRLKTSPNPIKLKKPAAEPVHQARPVPTPKPPRPRRIAKRKQATLRPVLMKLIVGVSAASAAVALQDRFPWPSGAKTAPLTTASIRRPEPKAAEKQPRARLERTFNGHTNAIRASAFGNGGRTLLTASEDGSLKIWDTASGAARHTIILPDGQALALAAHGNQALTSHRNGVIALWDLQTGRKIASFKRNNAQVWSVAFVGDGNSFAAASHDWKTALWDIRSPASPRHVFEGHKNAAQAVSYATTPRGPVIATAGADKTIKFWDAKTFKLLRTYRGHRDFINRITFAPDGRSFATASIDGNVRIWSTRSRKLFRSYKGHNGIVTGLTFDSAGKTLISAGKDTTIRLWNVKSRRRTARTLQAKGAQITALAFSPGHDRLAVSDANGETELWSLNPEAQISAK